MRASLIKVVAAFLAGLAVALASALIYVRVHDAHQTIPVTEIEQASEPETQAKTAAPETPPAAAEAPRTEPSTPEPSNATRSDTQASQPEPATAQPAQERPVRTSRVTQAPAPKPLIAKRTEPLPPVQVVQNTTPASLPSGERSSYPAVNQTSQVQPIQPGPEAVQSQPAAPPPPQPHVVELAEGSPLAIRLTETISTEHNYAGDTFRGTLDQPIIRNGFIIADRGSKVLGKIAEADKAGRVRGVAALSLALTEINTTDGQRIQVQTNLVEKRGQASTGADTAKIAGGAALGALIGALGGGGKGAAIGAGAGGAAGTGVVLATRGKAAVLPSESRLTFQLASPVTITEQLNH